MIDSVNKLKNFFIHRKSGRNILMIAGILALVFTVYRMRYQPPMAKFGHDKYAAKDREYQKKQGYAPYVNDPAHKYAGAGIYDPRRNLIGKVDKKGNGINDDGKKFGECDEFGDVFDGAGNKLGIASRVKPPLPGPGETAPPKTGDENKTPVSAQAEKEPEKVAVFPPLTQPASLLNVPPVPTAQAPASAGSGPLGQKPGEPAPQEEKVIPETITQQNRVIIGGVYSGGEEEYVDPDDVLPMGQFLRLKLVNTIDSSRLDTPAIGILTDDVWNNKRRFFVAGQTLVHGYMQQGGMRDRIGGRTKWIIVLNDPNNPEENGKELEIQAVAMDWAQDPTSLKYDITDGSAGLKGRIINTNKYADLKAFLAAALSGAGKGMTQMNMTSVGNETIQTYGGNWKDIVGSAGEKSFDLLTQRILAELGVDDIFVRVHAGKPFYLYTMQAIDISRARKGLTLSKGSTKN